MPRLSDEELEAIRRVLNCGEHINTGDSKLLLAEVDRLRALVALADEWLAANDTLEKVIINSSSLHANEDAREAYRAARKGGE